MPENEDNAREAQDTPVISVESNRNETDTREPVKPKKTNKLKPGKTIEGLVQKATPPAADEGITEATPGKFK